MAQCALYLLGGFRISSGGPHVQQSHQGAPKLRRVVRLQPLGCQSRQPESQLSIIRVSLGREKAKKEHVHPRLRRPTAPGESLDA